MNWPFEERRTNYNLRIGAIVSLSDRKRREQSCFNAVSVSLVVSTASDQVAEWVLTKGDIFD